MSKPSVPILSEQEIDALETDLLENHRQHIAYKIASFRCACQDLKAAVRNGDPRQAHETSQSVVWTRGQLEDVAKYSEHKTMPLRTIWPRETTEQKDTP